MKTEIISGVTTFTAESYADCLELLRSDYYRYLGRHISSIAALWFLHFKEPAMGFLFYFRLSQYKGIFYPYLRLRMEKYLRKYSLLIPRSLKTGKGLYLGHGTGIVINPTAVIGSNVNISQFTTVGSNNASAAVIEDGAYIGPSVCVVEHVRIGSCSVIGAGAVVTKDIPPFSKAAGVPAKVLGHSDYTPANKVEV